jgi:membrane protease YdiL (CAAX protease family)
MSPYLEIARQGKNSWWRYLLSIALILFMWFVVGSIPILLLAAYAGPESNPAAIFAGSGPSGLDPLLVLVATFLTFVPLFLATLFAVRVIHQRPTRTLITAAPRIRWSRLRASFGFWLALSVLVSVVEALLYPGRYVLTFQAGPFFAALLPMLILVPIQTSAEEIFVRGYIMQGLGLVFRRGWIVAVLSSIIFASLHLSNPEVSANLPLLVAYYFSFGLFAAIITLLDGGLELALGIHMANNLFSVLLANYRGSAVQSPSIFTNTVLDPVYSLVAPLVGMVIFYLWFLVLRRPRQPGGSPLDS